MEKPKVKVDVQQIIAMLGVEKFAAIERKIREIRESVHLPYIVRDYKEFKRVVTEYHSEYLAKYFHADPRPYVKNDENRYKFWQCESIDWLTKLLGGYNAYCKAEKDSIKGLDGGLIAVIDKVTEKLIEEHKNIYLRTIITDYIEPNDFEHRLKLAEEYLNRFGKHLYGNDHLKHIALIAANIESVIEGHIMALNQQRLNIVE
jgi:hypothetical protein